MKLYFSWVEQSTYIWPNCTSDVCNDDGFSPLCCLLTDTGGLGLETTLEWLEEGMDRIEMVKSGKIHFSSWGREDWGAELRKDEAKIYSLHDENYFELVKLEAFENALRN